MSEERRGLLYVSLAVLFFSTSPILTRWAAPLSPYEIATGRLGVAALAILVLAVMRRQPLRVARADLPRFLLFGFIAAVHFLCYIASIGFTTLAHALSIVYTAPIFVTLFSALFLKEPIPLRRWGGVAVAVVGVAILAGFEPRMTPAMLRGDLLALGSAITFGLYSVAGRSQRERYPLFTYATAVYGLAALWMLPIAALNFTASGYTLVPILSVIGLGILPLGVGHTLYNAALRRAHATSVNLIATQEVTGGVLLGILLLGEMPAINEIVGMAVTLAGIALVVL
jgi:drug/metabolite transporter (DMT)-like permease